MLCIKPLVTTESVSSWPSPPQPMCFCLCVTTQVSQISQLCLKAKKIREVAAGRAADEATSNDNVELKLQSTMGVSHEFDCFSPIKRSFSVHQV